MRIKLIIATLLVTATQAMAQKLFTLEELNFGGKNYKVSVPQKWNYSWQEGKLIFKDNDKTFEVNPANGNMADYQEPEKPNRPNPKGLLEWCKASNAAAFLRDELVQQKHHVLGRNDHFASSRKAARWRRRML